MTKNMDEIRKRLKDLRLQKGLSFQDLADLTGMSKSTLQRYETAYIKNLPLDKLEVLAKALGTSPEYIMGWEKDPSPPIPDTIAAHLDGAELSEDDVKDIADFIDYVIQRKAKKGE